MPGLREDALDFVPRYYTWDEFDEAAKSLARVIEEYRKVPKWRVNVEGGLYGIPRGGLPLAVALSHRTGLPLVSKPGPGVIVVDDIYDSGKTLNGVLTQEPGLISMCWLLRILNPEQTLIPGSFHQAAVISPSVWAIFPWEDPDKAIQDFRDYQAKLKG